MESSYLDENNSKQNESERNEIREELSKMSFEDLQKLKAELGRKVYKETMFGAKSQIREFKRKNKNRPQEVSSKIKPTLVQKVKKKKENPIIDPRFNRLCGTFNENHFRNVYDFLPEIKKKEKDKLKKMLKTEKNPEEIEKIQYLVKRMENQEREEEKRLKEKERRKKEKEEKIQAFNSGKQPYFRSKYENKLVQLVDKYSNLKKTGKIEKYIEKKEKKQKAKARAKRYFEVNIDDNET